MVSPGVTTVGLGRGGQMLQISVSVQFGKKSQTCRLSPYLPVENAVFFCLREFGVELQAPLGDFKLYKITGRSGGFQLRVLLDPQQSLTQQRVLDGVRTPSPCARAQPPSRSRPPA